MRISKAHGAQVLFNFFLKNRLLAAQNPLTQTQMPHQIFADAPPPTHAPALPPPPPPPAMVQRMMPPGMGNMPPGMGNMPPGMGNMPPGMGNMPPHPGHPGHPGHGQFGMHPGMPPPGWGKLTQSSIITKLY